MLLNVKRKSSSHINLDKGFTSVIYKIETSTDKLAEYHTWEEGRINPLL